MTVAELIAALQKLPQDAAVKIPYSEHWHWSEMEIQYDDMDGVNLVEGVVQLTLL